MRIPKNSWLYTTPIAHRGLWGEGIAENSLTAYKNAVEKGYAIEIDLYLSTDGVLYSFHDKTLERMTGEEGFIYEKSSKELDELTLVGTNEKIPTFDQVLEVCEGKAPLLIEIKPQPNEKVVDMIVERLRSYKGEFALQSFNPLYIKRVKKLAPEFIRGILANTSKADLKNEKFFKRLVVRKMLFNRVIKPDFISHSHWGLPLPKRRTKNKVVLAWTITDQQVCDRIKPYVDNIIFEHFIPDFK